MAAVAPARLCTTLLQLLASANICSRRPIWQQFDYLAGATVQGPGTSAAVLRLPGSSRKGIAAAIDCNVAATAA